MVFSLKELVGVVLLALGIFSVIVLFATIRAGLDHLMLMCSFLLASLFIASVREKILRLFPIQRESIKPLGLLGVCIFLSSLFFCSEINASTEQETFDFLQYVSILLISPLAEEVVFRGILLGFFNGLCGWLLSSAIVSIVFTLLHVGDISFIYVFFVSLGLCYAMRFSLSLTVCVLLHFAMNVAFLLFS